MSRKRLSDEERVQRDINEQIEMHAGRSAERQQTSQTPPETNVSMSSGFEDYERWEQLSTPGRERVSSNK